MYLSRAIEALFRAPFLTASVEAELWRDYSPAARARLILAYQPLVAESLKRLSPSEAYFEDCLSEGLLALIKSADRFRPELGVSFATFARLRIRGAMLDYLRAYSRHRATAEEADSIRFIEFASGGEHDLVSQERLAAAMASLTKLPAKERTVVKLLYIEDKSRDEVAALLGVSPSRVSQIHGRAIRRLKGMINARKRRTPEYSFAKTSR